MPTNNPILCRHLLVPHNLTQFWHYSPGDNIRSHMTPSLKVSTKNLSYYLCFSQLAVHQRSPSWLGSLLEKCRACRQVLYTLILAYYTKAQLGGRITEKMSRAGRRAEDTELPSQIQGCHALNRSFEIPECKPSCYGASYQTEAF